LFCYSAIQKRTVTATPDPIPESAHVRGTGCRNAQNDTNSSRRAKYSRNPAQNRSALGRWTAHGALVAAARGTMPASVTIVLLFVASACVAHPGSSGQCCAGLQGAAHGGTSGDGRGARGGMGPAPCDMSRGRLTLRGGGDGGRGAAGFGRHAVLLGACSCDGNCRQCARGSTSSHSVQSRGACVCAWGLLHVQSPHA